MWMQLSIVDSSGPPICFRGSTGQSHVCMWLEGQAGRWSEEVASCLNNYIHTKCEEGGLQNMRSLIAWLDSCGGQNKNKYLMSFWYSIVHVIKAFESVEHKFPVPSHTYLMCDRDFDVKTLLYMIQNPCLTSLNWRNRRTLSRLSEWCKKNTVSISQFHYTLNFRTKDLRGQLVHLCEAARIVLSRDHPRKMLAIHSKLFKKWIQSRRTKQVSEE